MTTEKTLTDEFEKVRPHLKSFVLRMTASVEDTEDLLQDTFIKSFQNIQTFKGAVSAAGLCDYDTHAARVPETGDYRRQNGFKGHIL